MPSTTKLQVPTIIVALDNLTPAQIIYLVQRLRKEPNVIFKIGLECVMSTFTAAISKQTKENREILAHMRKLFKLIPPEKRFMDIKLHDIPTTVTLALAPILAQVKPALVNVHAQGGSKMMAQCVEILKTACPQTKFIAVTVLTSMDDAELYNTSYSSIDHSLLSASKRTSFEGITHAATLHLAHLAKQAGFDGVVSSPWNTAEIRTAQGKEFYILNPSIRASDEPQDDQKQAMPLWQATLQGANAVVLGRTLLRTFKALYDQDKDAAGEALMKRLREVRIEMENATKIAEANKAGESAGEALQQLFNEAA